MYHLICFTDFVPEPEIRYTLGYTYVIFAASNILVHLLLILRSNILKLIEKLKEWKHKRRAGQEEQEKVVEVGQKVKKQIKKRIRRKSTRRKSTTEVEA